MLNSTNGSITTPRQEGAESASLDSLHICLIVLLVLFPIIISILLSIKYCRKVLKSRQNLRVNYGGHQTPPSNVYVIPSAPNLGEVYENVEMRVRYTSFDNMGKTGTKGTLDALNNSNVYQSIDDLKMIVDKGQQFFNELNENGSEGDRYDHLQVSGTSGQLTRNYDRFLHLSAIDRKDKRRTALFREGFESVWKKYSDK